MARHEFAKLARSKKPLVGSSPTSSASFLEGSDNGYSTGFENRRPKGLASSNLAPSANFQNSDFGRLLPRPARGVARLPPRF